ncbi:beta-galactosidase [Jatrophihabitans sp.]|uniref:beta-galactosidase n=1 Tax=Jatrophihabitans sp. TaxID=1932789 RepID=UPI0032C21C71
MYRVTDALGGRFAYGGDYNPEQWPEETWAEDVALMQEAGVNLVSLGIFSWSLLEPEEGRYELGLLERVIALLDEGGIKVDLATGTASPPPWFHTTYPHTLPVDRIGVRRSFGARQAYCPSAPEYRRAAAALAGTIAARFADHPAVVMWHINNEYGCHNWHCFCDVSAAAYREWLERRYGTLDDLNAAWGTAFWSQRYTAWAQLDPPRAVSYNSFANPTNQLDFWRFSSDELLDCFRAEATAIRAVAGQPLTTNFMGLFKPLDYRAWAPEQDLVSNDHYLLGADADPTEHLAICADLMRSLAQGDPWLLMEHSTSAVNWQARNLAKTPGQLRRNSLQHLSRGADGALFFQWRASRAGAEKFHSGLVPHAGTDSKVWREVVAFGADLRAMAEVTGSRVESPQVALLFDWTSWWAAELDSHPSADVDPVAELRRWHGALWRRNITADVVGPGDALAGYRLVIVPVQYLGVDATLAALREFTEAGGTLLVTYFSAIVDEHDHVRLGGYPGGLRELLGVRIEEFFPLPENGRVALTDLGSGRVWSELGVSTGAEVLAAYADGPVAGSPAITRNAAGAGAAWYVGTALDDVAPVLERVLADAAVEPTVEGLSGGVEAVRRTDGRAAWLFLLNHTDATVPIPVRGTDLLTGARPAELPPGGVAVVREDVSS